MLGFLTSCRNSDRKAHANKKKKEFSSPPDALTLQVCSASAEKLSSLSSPLFPLSLVPCFPFTSLLKHPRAPNVPTARNYISSFSSIEPSPAAKTTN